MFTLKYEDLTDNRTFTYQVVEKHQKNIEELEKKLAREKEFSSIFLAYMRFL